MSAKWNGIMLVNIKTECASHRKLIEHGEDNIMGKSKWSIPSRIAETLLHTMVCIISTQNCHHYYCFFFISAIKNSASYRRQMHLIYPKNNNHIRLTFSSLFFFYFFSACYWPIPWEYSLPLQI